jgi:signal transduction histidine kinase
MWYGADGEHLAEFRRMTEETEFAPGIGLPGCALASGKPLSVIDVTKERNFPRQPSAMKCGLRGASAFPVLSGQDVVAVLEFFTTEPREPSEAFLNLMSQIGLQLGRVVERQRAETRLHDHAAELTRARDDAKAADKAKSAFLATMSHELRTPLNAIIGFSEMIQTELLGPIGNAYYKGYATNIFNSGTHLLGIINDILDISKLDSDVVDLRDDLVDLAGTIGECVRLLDPQAVQANVRLSQAIAPDLPMLRADQKRLRQILFNLISNAIKFTPEGGHVRASATRRREGLVIAVADTGIGMTAEQIPKALERFGQIDSTLARKYEGTGLGLPLTKRLVELHGGVLTIDSKPSVGTTVSATFPEIRIVARPHAA